MTRISIALAVFVAVIVLILWRPRKINEALPAMFGAGAVLALGYINYADVGKVLNIVSGAGAIILSTIVMSFVLDKAGFFQWGADQVVIKANGSGRKLFVLVLLLCFLMTMFFNNDGSVLITTPIIVHITKKLKFSKLNALPYMLGGALIASSSSAPIGVSNLANLIALRIVGLNLNAYAKLMFLPSMLGIIICGLLLFVVFRHNIPATYQLKAIRLDSGPEAPVHPAHPKLQHGHVRTKNRPAVPAHHEREVIKTNAAKPFDPVLAKIGIVTVVLVRVGLFVAQAFNVPIELVAISGAALLLAVYAVRSPKGALSIFREVPWHIFLFAFGMYAIVYALHNLGMTALLGDALKTFVGTSLFKSILATGGLLTIMSSLMNNLPSVMVGTIMLTDVHFPIKTLQLSYLANIVGSDIGSLLLPLGTLASLLWFHIVSKQYPISWIDYIKVSFRVIPPTLIITLVALYFWGNLIM